MGGPAHNTSTVRSSNLMCELVHNTCSGRFVRDKFSVGLYNVCGRSVIEQKVVFTTPFVHTQYARCSVCALVWCNG
jgi:hypothetical protein